MRKMILVLLVCVSRMAFAFDAKPVLDSANRAYLKGEFSHASNLYEAILQNGYESADLYFNLGNAYYKQNKIADAILNFERAKKLSPKDEDINFNLAVASRQTVDKIEAVNTISVKGWWQSFTGWMGPDGWGWMSFMVFALALGAFLFFITGSSVRIRKAGFTAGLVLLAALVFGLTAAFTQYSYASRQDSCIVFRDELKVKSSPEDSGKDIFIIHLGTKVDVVESLNGWIEIRLPNKSSGWVKEADVRLI